MTAYNAGDIEATATLDRDPFIAGLQAMKREGDEFARRKFTAKLGLDTAPAKRALREIRTELASLRNTEIRLKVDRRDVAAAIRDVERLRAATRGLNDVTARGQADAIRAQAELERVRLQAARLAQQQAQGDARLANDRARLIQRETEMRARQAHADARNALARERLIQQEQLSRARLAQQAQSDADRTRLAEERLALARQRADQTSSRSSREATHNMGLMRVAIEQLGPPLIPLAGGALALGAALGAMGAAGVLAFQGIKAEVKANTVLGQQYMAMLQAAKVNARELSRTSAIQITAGLGVANRNFSENTPQLDIIFQRASRTLGTIIGNLSGGFLGALSQATGMLTQGENVLEGWSAQFRDWGQGDGPAKLFRTLSTDLEHAVPAIENLFGAIGHIGSGLNPIATAMLDNITALSSTIRGIPVGIISTAASAYLTFRTVVAVTGGIKAATMALREFAGASAAAGAGGAAAGAGGSRLASVLTRGAALATGLYVGGSLVRNLGNNNPAYNQPGNMTSANTAGFEHAVGSFFTGHWGDAWSDTFGAHRQQQQDYVRMVDKFRKGIAATAVADPKTMSLPALAAAAKTQGIGNGVWLTESQQRAARIALQWQTHQTGGYDPQGNMVLTPGHGTSFTDQYQRAYDRYSPAMQRATNNTQQLLGQQLGRTADLNSQSNAYAMVDKSLQKTINSQQKWLSLGGPTLDTYKGVKIGAETYARALADTNGDQSKATALVRASIDSMNHNKTALEVNQDRQQRLNEDVGAAMQKYSLTATQVSTYTSMLGINADQLGRGVISQKQYVRAIGEIVDKVNNGSTAVQGWAAAVEQFNSGADTAATRGQLIAAALQAANGDALSFAGSMVNAAVANQQLVTVFDRSLINLKTGAIDYHNAAAAPMISALQQIQTANMNAAAAVYQHELAQRGGKKAATDAYNTYVNNTRGALIDEAQHFGMTADQAKRFADQYFGLSDAKNIKKSIQAIGTDKVTSVLKDILSTLLSIGGLHAVPTVDVGGDGAAVLAGVTAQLNNLNNRVVTYTINGVTRTIVTDPTTGTRHPGVPQSATGTRGRYVNHGFSTVGEGGAGARPELLYTDASGTIVIPHTTAKQVAAQRGLNAPGLYPQAVPMYAGGTVSLPDAVPGYASGTGEGGGFTGVKYPDNAATGGGNSGGKGGSATPKKTPASERWYEYRGLWYQGREAYNEAVAAHTSSEHPGSITHSGKSGPARGYGYRGEGYATTYEAANARTEYLRGAQAGGRQITRQAAASGLTTHSLRQLANAKTDTVLGAAGDIVDDAKAARDKGSLADKWVKQLVDDNKTLTAALTHRDRLVQRYKDAEQKVKDLKNDQRDAAHGYRDTILGGFDVGTSGNGYRAGITSTLDTKIADATKFEKLRKQATALGLDPKLLKQIISEGPQAAGANLEAIVGGGKAYVDSLDKKYAQFEAVATTTGNAQAAVDYQKRISDAQTHANTLHRQQLAAQRVANQEIRDLRRDVKKLPRELTEAGRTKGKG